jgi:TP901 family phage tail tape measure protein
MATGQTAHITVTMDGKQAEQMLKVLDDRYKSLKDEMNALRSQSVFSQQDLDRMRSLATEITKTGRALGEMRRQAGDVSQVLANLSTSSARQLSAAYKTARDQLAGLTRGTQEYADKHKQVALLRTEIDKINASGRQQNTIFGQVGATIKRLAAYVLVYAAFNKVTDGLRKMFKMNTELSDQLADIRKTTGLTSADLARLSADLIAINTRIPVEQLNKLAYEAGKLGIKGRDNILQFVRAANQINLALGEDLGDDAIVAVAKLNDVMGETARLGYEQSMLATGSAINELSQNSTAAAPYLVDFAKRLGGIARQAGLTIPQILALGSVADQMGQNVEVSATALNKLITTIVAKTDQVARAIGVTSAELREALGRSTWDGLLLVFDKLADKGGLAALAPIMGDLGSDGARLTQVIAAMTSGTEKLRTEIDLANKSFNEASSVSKEAAIREDTLAANIEKIGKNIERWFLGSDVVDFLNYFAKGLADATSGTNSLNEILTRQVDRVANLKQNIEPLLDEYERLKDAKTADEQERLKTVLAQISQVLPGAVTLTGKYGEALAISTEQARLLIEQQQILMQTEHAAAIKRQEAETARLKSLYEQQTAITKQIDELGGFYKETANLQGGTNTTFVVLNKNKADAAGLNFFGEMLAFDAEKADEAIRREKELQRQYLNDYQASLKTLKALNGDLLKEAMKASEMRQQARQEELDEQKRFNAMNKQQLEEWLADEKHFSDRFYDHAKSLYETLYGDPRSGKDNKKSKTVEQWQIELDAVQTWVDGQRAALAQARIDRTQYNDQTIDSETAYNEQLEQIEWEALQRRLKILNLPADKEAEFQRTYWDMRLRFFSRDEKATTEYRQKLENLLDRFDLQGQHRLDRDLLRLRQHYNDGVALLDDALRRKLISEKQYYEQRELLLRAFNDAEQRYLEQQSAREDLQHIGILEDRERVNMRQQYINGEIAYEQYQRGLLDLELQYADARMNVWGLNEEQRLELLERYQELRFKSMDDQFQREKRKLDAYRGLITDTFRGLGDAFSKFFETSENKEEAFWEAIVDTTFDGLTRIIDIWLMEAQAQAAAATFGGMAESVKKQGIKGLITSAAIAAAIQAGLQVAKAAIKSAIKRPGSGSTGQRVVNSGYAQGGYVNPPAAPAGSHGGYTGRGATFQPAGIVHRGEYVTPQWQLRDPFSLHYIRILDAIRRQRTALNPLPRHFASGGPVDDTLPADAAAPQTDASAQTLDNLNLTLAQLHTLLRTLQRDGIPARLNYSHLEDYADRLNRSRFTGSRQQ